MSTLPVTQKIEILHQDCKTLYNAPIILKIDDMHKMHTKYSKNTLLSSRHDYEVNKFHNRLSRYKIRQLTRIGQILNQHIKELHIRNQLENMLHFNKNISEHAEISTDNWLMKIHAYKNKDYITENHKRYERYLIWKYKTNAK